MSKNWLRILVLSGILFCSSGGIMTAKEAPLQRKEAMVQIENKVARLSIGKDTGWIRSIVWKDKNIDLCKQVWEQIKGYIGWLRVYDERERKWFNDYDQNFTVSDFKQDGNQVSFNKHFTGAAFNLRATLTMEDDSLNWEVVMEKKSKETLDRGIRVSFVLPLIGSWKVWAPASEAQFEYDRMTSFEYFYCQLPDYGKNEVAVPILSNYSPKKDVGYSVIVPFDQKIPATKFLFQNGDRCFMDGNDRPIEDYPVLEVINYYIGLIQDRKLTTSCRVFFHEGDWRPGLGMAYNRYKEYFVPKDDILWDKQGVFKCGIFEDADQLDKLKKVQLKYFELHGSFFCYGEYFPPQESWRRFWVAETIDGAHNGQMPIDEVWEQSQTLSDAELLKQYGIGIPNNSRQTIHDSLKKFNNADVNAYYYFNYNDGFWTWAKKNYESCMSKMEDGNYYRHGEWGVMNADLKYPFGQHLLKEAGQILEEYPELSGLFLDVFRHFEFDFGHDDGVTVANNKPIYSINFAYDALTEEIQKLLQKQGKSAFANKPYTIRSAKYVDGVMVEGDGDAMQEKLFYLCLAKPLLMLFYNGDGSATEENLRKTVVYGAYPGTPPDDFLSDTAHGKEQLERDTALYAKYVPLFQQFDRRVFCFEPDPMRLPQGMTGKLYTVKGDYVAGVRSEGVSDYDKYESSVARYVYFRVKRGFDVGEVTVMYPGDKEGRSVKFLFNGSIIGVPLEGYRNCGVIRLKVTGNTGKEIKAMDYSEVIQPNCDASVNPPVDSFAAAGK